MNRCTRVGFKAGLRSAWKWNKISRMEDKNDKTDLKNRVNSNKANHVMFVSSYSDSVLGDIHPVFEILSISAILISFSFCELNAD